MAIENILRRPLNSVQSLLPLQGKTKNIFPEFVNKAFIDLKDLFQNPYLKNNEGVRDLANKVLARDLVIAGLFITALVLIKPLAQTFGEIMALQKKQEKKDKKTF